MRCTQVKERLIEQITAAGIQPPGNIQDHLDACDDCRVYYRELSLLSESLLPLDDISMTAEESAKLEAAVGAVIGSGGRWNTCLKPEKKMYAIVRAAAAMAALVLIVLVVSGKQTADEAMPMYSIDEFDLSHTSAEDMAPLFVNGDQDYLPSLVDEEKAAYLTDQVYPAEAEEILESATTEEIEWLMENYSLEI